MIYSRAVSLAIEQNRLKLPATLGRTLLCSKGTDMTKHAVNTTEAVPRLKPLKARGLIFHPFDESDRALDDDFEQMSKRYTQKNTEVSTS